MPVTRTRFGLPLTNKQCKNMIPVNTPILNGNERQYLNECIDTGWISSEGPFVTRFEESFAAVVGRRYAVAVCNGSVALDAAIVALGIGEGDEVIIPTFTIISCAAAIVRVGAIPVVVDADPITWNMNVEEVKLKITSKTKAIMVVHIYGLPVDMAPIESIAKEYGLKIIEDAAEVHGQTYHGRKCGSFGEVSTFSFYPNKHITTGEGGMIVTDSLEIAERCRSLRNLCFQSKRRFVHEELGWNLRMTNLQAALGLAQLERLVEFVDKKRRMGKLYTELLKEVDEIQIPIERTAFAENIYWVYGIVLKESVSFNAQEAMRRLGQQGIGTRPFFFPMHLQPVFTKMGLFQGLNLPVSEKIAERGFYLPSGLALTDDEIVEVTEKVKELFR
jgi:perosamine synthetase